ncbi:MAG: radical SAM protein [Desulfobulbaceae bacterium]|nr:radical SAM protein [Desulfobulbaceae bacterium]
MSEIKKYEHFTEKVVGGQGDVFDDPIFSEYRKKWIELPDKKILSKFPMNLDICLTNRCNLRCVMCRRTQEIKKGIFQDTPGDMDFEIYKKIIDEVASKGGYAVHLSGDGEPLFHKDIIKMIRYAREKNILDLFMHTNATLLFEDVAAELIDAGLTRLIISIDSHTKDTYESIRVGANFDVVVKNIRTLMKMKREKGLKYPFVRVQAVDMNNNYEVRQQYDEFFSEIVDSIGHIEYINYNKLDETNRAYRDREYNNDYVCNQLWQRLCVNYDGNVYSCLIINDDSLLGSIVDSTISDLWLGDKMQSMRKVHLEGGISGILPCLKCGFQSKTVQEEVS